MASPFPVYLPGDVLEPEGSVFASKKKVEPAGSLEAPQTALLDAVRCHSASTVIELPVAPYSPKALVGASRVYFPRVGDLVVGIVTFTHADGYRVDINSPFEANLSATGFNNATKQNRPRLVLGSVVVARVIWTGLPEKIEHKTTQRFTATSRNTTSALAATTKKPASYYQTHGLDLNDSSEISCLTPDDPRSWSTGEAYLGELERHKGYCFEVPLAVAISLQADDCYILDRLGQVCVFEISVGRNGRIWVRGETPATTVLVTLAIQQAIGLNLPQMECLIQHLIKRFQALQASDI